VELTFLPIDSSLLVFNNGSYKTKTKDYSIDGKVITFVTAANPGEYVSVTYMY
jgi:hypothetical protein